MSSILSELSAASESSIAEPSVFHATPTGRAKEAAMAQKVAGYGRRWKRWLAIYAVVGVVAYLILFLLFFHGGGGSAGGGFHY
jgi:hypothetical protein